MRGLSRSVVGWCLAVPLAAALLTGCGKSKEEVAKQDAEGTKLNKEMMDRMIQQQGNVGGSNQGQGGDPGTEVSQDPGASPMPGQPGGAVGQKE
jgi:hypothetical protein